MDIGFSLASHTAETVSSSLFIISLLTLLAQGQQYYPALPTFCCHFFQLSTSKRIRSAASNIIVLSMLGMRIAVTMVLLDLVDRFAHIGYV